MQDVYFLVSIPQFFEIKHVRFTFIIQIISGIEKERERVKKVFFKNPSKYYINENASSMTTCLSKQHSHIYQIPTMGFGHIKTCD